MLKRKIELRPERLYQADEWRIVEARFSDESVGLTRPSFRLATDSSASAAASRRTPGAGPGTFVSYLIEEGDPLEVVIRGEPDLLSPGPPVTIKVPPP